MLVSRIKSGKLNCCFEAVVATMLALSLAGSAVAQDGSDRFVDPVIESAETLGGLRFGGSSQSEEQDQQFEDIEGEVVPGSAVLSEPDFGPYGPVSPSGSVLASPGVSAADQSPRLEQQPESGVISRTQVLPNEYQGETLYPEWMGRDSNGGQSSSRRPPIQDQRPRSIKKPLRTLRIDGMKAIKDANREFDSRSHEIVRERYPDGSVKIVRTIAQDADGNYYNDGGWLMYDRQQRPIASGTYVRGAMEGDWERIHEVGTGGLFSQMPFRLYSGPFLSRANFVRNKIDGVWSISDKDDKLIFSITFENGVRNGLASWFFPNGKKMREATFKEGVPHGIVLQWDQQGKLQRREQFVDGRKVIRKKSTYANQILASERVYRDQKLTPMDADNWWAAKPATYGRDGEEVQYGPVAEWYPNRQPKMTGRYIDGQRDGLFTWWHQSHNKKAEGNFSRGQRVGRWRYWHESGMKRSEGQFENDQPIGLWREWDENGQVIDEKTLDPNATEAEEVVGEAVDGDEVESESNSVLDKTDAGFKIELGVPQSDDPISNDDPFNEEPPQEEPGGLGSVMGN